MTDVIHEVKKAKKLKHMRQYDNAVKAIDRLLYFQFNSIFILQKRGLQKNTYTTVLQIVETNRGRPVVYNIREVHIVYQ